jgi:uncharacterized protein (DUF983 family)
METSKENNESYYKAKESVRQVQIFYMHVVGYIIIVALLSYNIYIAEGIYRNFFVWLDNIFLVLWTIFIIVHGCRVFKKRIFKKSWEERKMQEFIAREKKQKK